MRYGFVQGAYIEACLRTGNPENALKLLSRANRDPALSARAEYGLVRALIACNKGSEALELAEEVLSIKPDDPLAGFAMSEALEAVGRKQEARALRSKLPRDRREKPYKRIARRIMRLTPWRRSSQS